MELLEGETLQDRIERYGRLSPRLTIEIIRQAGIALARAHDLGIVPRDIKPENVFLVESGAGTFVKLLDFGIASEAGLGADEVVGTPHFMSPEQMDGSAVDPSVDVWALGVMTYYCLTGRLPFIGRDLPALSVASRRGPAIPLAELLTEPVPGLELWIQGAMEPDPFLRYADARTALDALDAMLQGSQLQLDRPPPRRTPVPDPPAHDSEDELFTTQEMRGLARRRLASRVAAVAAVMGFAAFGVYAIGGHHPDAPEVRASASALLANVANAATWFE
jgi:serine/threonine protein kinase